MELNKEDFKLLLDINNKKFLGLRHDYFTNPNALPSVSEVVKEAMEEKKEVEIIVEPEPEPTKEELAEIKKQKLIEKKKAELSKLLEE